MAERKGGLDPKIKYTVTSFEKSSFLFDILQLTDFRGLNFLEIGAGQSDIVAQLRARGAVPYAVDPGYGKPEVLDRMVDKYLAEEILPQDQEWFDHLQTSRRRFRRDFANFRKYYKDGYSTELPFPKNSFDLVVSSFCICPVVSPNLPDLLQSIKEVIRVLKPGKIAEICPFDNHEDLNEGDLEKAERHGANLLRVKEYLVSSNQRYMDYDLQYNDNSGPLSTRKLLVIQKAS